MAPGDWDAASAATGKRVVEHGTRRFFADCGSLTTNVSLFEVMAFVESLSALGAQSIEKEAVLLPPDGVAAEQITFFETACRNRGLDVRLARERAEALAWLAE